jgi:acyl-CoA-binding protein
MTDSEVEKQFLKYVEIGRNLPKQAPDVMLIAYGFYKQALVGDIDEERPSENSDVVRTFMHDQWKRLEGMSKTAAKLKYIDFIKELVIQNEAASKAEKSK